MPLFSRLKNKGAQTASKSKTQPDLSNGIPTAPVKPRWQSTWSSRTIDPEEVEELVHACTAELKLRGDALNAPFLLLPFRPGTDASSARPFIRDFYKSNGEGSPKYRAASLAQELRLTEAPVLCSIIKWCWSRMPGGVVSWPVYNGFLTGERDSRMARNAFHTFVPIGAGSEARTNIIFDFFNLLAAIAAHGKMNGLGGRKLSRLAGWWAFEHSDDGKGFEGGYRSWTTAADASSHLFFAYLRSQSPDAHPSMNVIERIPRSLQALLASTEYPPETPTLLQRSTPRVVLLVDTVSPTPFALLRRAKHFEYRDRDRVLREYSEFDDPVDALTDECKRVLYAISSINSAAALSRSGHVGKTGQESWSAIQNMGFSDLDQTMLSNKPSNHSNGMHGMNGSAHSAGQGLRAAPRSRNNGNRPTTPSWADFLSSGFSEDDLPRTNPAFSMPSGNMLPPIGSRTPSRQVNGGDDVLAPGEMAAIVNVELDDAFWWVWMTSLSGEEPADRKSVFGRCALIETTVLNGRWLIMEEQVKGASPDPAEEAYIAPKKSSIFSFTKRGKGKEVKVKNDNASFAPSEPLERVTSPTPSKGSLAPDQASRIKSAAAELARRQTDRDGDTNQRRGRYDDAASVKTSSMMTMGMMSEASPAMRWANAYDKNATRKQYLGDSFAGKGLSADDPSNRTSSVMLFNDGASSVMPTAPALSPGTSMFPSDAMQDRELPALPREEQAVVGAYTSQPTELPADNVAYADSPQEPRTLPGKAPEVHISPADDNEVLEEPEQIPLPETTYQEHSNPLEKELGMGVPPVSPTRIGRKPVPRSGDLSAHPAFRQKPVEESVEEPEVESNFPAQPPRSSQSPTNPAAIAAQRAMEVQAPSSSPESQKYAQAPLKKQGGLKKFFGRKKDNPNRNSLDAAAQSTTNGLAPPSESNLGRRLSLMRKKPSPRSTPRASQPAIPQTTPESRQEPTMPDSHSHFQGSMASLSQVNTPPDANPHEEFSRFDQGPVEMPAYPHSDDGDEYEGLHAPAPQRYNTALASRIAPERQREPEHDAEHEPEHEPEYEHEPEDARNFVTPMERRSDMAEDAQSEASMDDHRQPESDPSQDRWAKIRENAAKRAARASEEQSTKSRPSQSVRETDDGETSGEETIESRVARIKARVAELTGNIDGPHNGVSRK
ncbi:multicopy suppressor of a budding defect [Friedmanniomyces endolithicus]|nr:multicopy suppressor of a budding defect [Friedmanniomyces endolithicus]KAK0816192.1 multicopy suppressor of a budding defect [Friedmanniomyces endolithicus]KAK0911657.1 multicopy suppressor of a budding defect [Friedmanniomyces endolithicus]